MLKLELNRKFASNLPERPKPEVFKTAHKAWDPTNGGNIGSARRFNYEKEIRLRQEMSPGPTTNLHISTIKGNKVILPKIDSRSFNK